MQIIQTTTGIFRSRWPEVTLLAVMWAAMLLLSEEMLRQWVLAAEADSKTAAAPEWAMFLLGMGFMSLWIILHLLVLGFLRTAATDGETPHEPVQLLMAGRPFLWRIIGFQFLSGLALWAVTAVMVTFYFGATGRPVDTQPPAWLAEIIGAAATVLMVKPLFLIPAFVMVLNMTLAEAFVRMIAVPLHQIRTLVKLVIVGSAVAAAVGIGVSFVPEQGALHYVASGVNCLARSVIFLVLLTAAAVWTAGVFLPPAPPVGDATDE